MQISQRFTATLHGSKRRRKVQAQRSHLRGVPTSRWGRGTETRSCIVTVGWVCQGLGKIRGILFPVLFCFADEDDANRLGEKVILREQVKELFNEKYGESPICTHRQAGLVLLTAAVVKINSIEGLYL